MRALRVNRLRLMPRFEAEDFWQWSGQHYANEDVKNACLALQDEFGLNVNLLLLCQYAQTQGLGISIGQIPVLIACIGHSDEALRAHRAQRKAAKTGDPSVYTQLLEQELAMERAQQSELIACLNSFGELPATGTLNAVHYTQYHGLPLTPPIIRLLRMLSASA